MLQAGDLGNMRELLDAGASANQINQMIDAKDVHGKVVQSTALI